MTDNTPRPEPMSREQVLAVLDRAISAALYSGRIPDAKRQELPQARAAVAALYDERDALRRFALALFEIMDWPEGGDLDAIDFQELATQHGLLLETEQAQSCGEGCFCAGVDEPPFVCFRKTPLLTGTEPSAVAFDMLAHLRRQREWSERTFGPGSRTAGVVDHIRKELCEIEADPLDPAEWVDVVILGLDGAWRCGWSPEQIIAGIVAKQTRNEGRQWPDWRTADTDKAIEHTKESPQ